MANEVEIRITANDLSGPAFASALAKLEALKAAAKDAGSSIVPDTASMTSALSALKAKIQSMGIADIADVNIQPGVISQRLQLLKRLVSQAGISDLVDMNVSDSTLMDQLAKLHGISEEIPVTFDVGALPQLGLTRGLTDNIGLTESELANLTTARSDFGALGMSVDEVNAKMGVLNGTLYRNAAVIGMAWDEAEQLDRAYRMDWAEAAAMNAKIDENNAKVLALAGTMGAAVPLVDGFGVSWWRLTGKFQLFGGVLTGLGIPSILATASSMHILVDWVAEFLAVILPATVALAAFGVGAAPTIGDIYTRMVGVFNVSRALNQNIYPMSGAFVKLANAVQPSVYKLFGDALDVVNAKTGAFQSIAVQTGDALDQLGARATAALVNGGIGTFLKNGPADVAGLGNIMGNLFGILGNFLKTVPGYAQVILRAWQDVTGALEAVTASPITQWILRLGLIAHGAVLYIGLFTTGIIFLGNSLVSLAAKFGLAADEAVFFNGAAFGQGLVLLAKEAWAGALAMVGLGAAEDTATAATIEFSASQVILDSISPFAWIALAVAGFAALVYELTRSTSATQAYDNAVKGALSNAPISNLSLDLMRQAFVTTNLLVDSELALGRTQEYVNTVNLHTGATIQTVSGNYRYLAGVVDGYRQELSTIKNYQDNFNALLKVAGGNLGALNAAGITSNDIIGASKVQMQQYAIEIEAVVNATNALALGTGRNAAALNAESNLYLTENIPALQQLTQAEDNLLNVITAGPTAFITYAQGLATMATDAKATGARIGGLSAASLTLTSDFYTNVANAQKLTDALQQQGASTGLVTSAVATMGKEMLKTAGSNLEAKGILVDYINGALGPGTVNLQTITGWVDKFGGSLRTLNQDQAQAAEGASVLAGILNSDVKNALSASALQASGFQSALQKLTTDLEDKKPASTLAQDQADVYNSLIKSGVGATTAKGDLDAYFKQLGITPPEVTTQILLNDAYALKAIQIVRGELASLNGATADTYINVIQRGTIGGPVAVGGRAGGGVIGMAAGGGVRNGLTWVGEHGPELADLAPGTTVHSNPDSMSIIDRAIQNALSSVGSGYSSGSSYMPGGSQQPISIDLTMSYDGSAEKGLSADMLKKIRYTVVHKGGGDVQQAFGRNGA
jgi:hypothetical protein